MKKIGKSEIKLAATFILCLTVAVIAFFAPIYYKMEHARQCGRMIKQLTYSIVTSVQEDLIYEEK